MSGLLVLAVVLLVLWVMAEALGWALGVLLNLLWIGALVLFLVWAVGWFRART